MATGDLFLHGRNPDCPVLVGEFVELGRLPGLLFKVEAILQREDLESLRRYLLELIAPNGGTVHLWHDDPEEKLWSLTELAPWEEPLSSAVLEGE